MRRVGKYVSFRQVLTNIFCINVKNWLSLNARGLIWLYMCVLWLVEQEETSRYMMYDLTVYAVFTRKKGQCSRNMLCGRAFLWFALKLQKNLVFYLRYATVQCKQRPDYKSSLYLASLAFIIEKECCSNINTDTPRLERKSKYM